VNLERVPITIEGYHALKKELEKLKSVERPENIKAIETARAHGDLSENAEFTAAKERQSFIEELSKDRAVFGVTVVLENIDTGDEVQYQIVGPDESNIEEKRISVSSPLGKAIIGKKPGDEVILQAPGGKRSYELVEIL